LHSVTSPTQHQELPSSGHRHMSPQCAQSKVPYPHSPQELMSPNQSSPVGGGMAMMGSYTRTPQQSHQRPSPQTMVSSTSHNARCYPPQWNPLSGGTIPVSSHLSYTTTIVPESLGQHANKSHMDMVSAKVDLLRDERGVPEGASSSPRSSYDSQYHHHHHPHGGSPTRDQNNLVLRHPPPLDIST